MLKDNRIYPINRSVGSNMHFYAYTSAFATYHNLTNIFQQISNGAFLARKGNILSYINQTDYINKIEQKIYKIN